MQFPIQDVRSKFPALSICDNGRPRVYLDNAAGTQVPQQVIEAVSRVYLECNANSGAFSPTSQAVDALYEQGGGGPVRILWEPQTPVRSPWAPA